MYVSEQKGFIGHRGRFLSAFSATSPHSLLPRHRFRADAYSREMVDRFSTLAECCVRLPFTQVYWLVVERPERLSVKVLMALLDILDWLARSTWSVGGREKLPMGGQLSARWWS